VLDAYEGGLPVGVVPRGAGRRRRGRRRPRRLRRRAAPPALPLDRPLTCPAGHGPADRSWTALAPRPPPTSSTPTLTGVESHDVALVLGSGWLPAADALGDAAAEIATTELPGFGGGRRRSRGKIRSSVSRRRAEGAPLPRPHPPLRGPRRAAVVHGVRVTAAAAGCRTVVLTNGCGGLRPDLVARHAGADQRPHQPDATSPIEGATSSTSPTSTPPAARALPRVDPSLDEGVYVQFPGRTTRPRPRSAWCARSAATWSA
jgi:hypothetical protein